VIVDVVMTSVK